MNTDELSHALSAPRPICASSAFICGQKNASDDDWKTRLTDMTAEMTIRLATPADAAAIAAIYNQGIAE
ncbi:MAG TPA: hypothetical protein VE914_05320, partial [Candidatus Angelobacter sp.]|nr:hypothetical protein [Candidatus Angelobacter sp.]